MNKILKNKIMKTYFYKSLAKFKDVFPKEVLENIEKIYRLETANFKSEQYYNTYSAGMEAFSDKYPYGWTSIANNLWNIHQEYAPVGIITMAENRTGKTKYFLKFKTPEAGIASLGTFLEIYKNNAGRWYSLTISGQAEYLEKLKKIEAKYVKELFS